MSVVPLYKSLLGMAEAHQDSDPPPWRQPRSKLMVSLVNSHTNATRTGWHLWEIDLDLPQGYLQGGVSSQSSIRNRELAQHCCTNSLLQVKQLGAQD